MEDKDKILKRINDECSEFIKEIDLKPTTMQILLTFICFAFVNLFIHELYSLSVLTVEFNVSYYIQLFILLAISTVLCGSCFLFKNASNFIPFHLKTYKLLCVSWSLFVIVAHAIYCYTTTQMGDIRFFSYNFDLTTSFETIEVNIKEPNHMLVEDEVLENHLPLYTIYIPILEPVGLDLYYIDEELYFNYTTNIGQATFKAELLDDSVIVDYSYQLEYLGMEGYSGKNAEWQILDTIYLEIDNTLLFYTNSDKDIYVVSVIGSEKFYLFDYSNIEVSDDFVVKNLNSLLEQGLRVDSSTSPTDEVVMFSPNYPYYNIEFTDESSLTLGLDRQMPLLHNPYDIQVNFRITDRHGVDYLNKDISNELNKYAEFVQLLNEEVANFDLGLSNKIYCFLEVYNGSKFVRCSNSIIITKEEYEKWNI